MQVPTPGVQHCKEAVGGVQEFNSVILSRCSQWAVRHGLFTSLNFRMACYMFWRSGPSSALSRSLFSTLLVLGASNVSD